ncbi:hypothetical protein NC651_015459 [Populus alba x Populus x berolinensis]|nr:hypothetical protein NC651_015459 [Populus alba x Populus x berolinensis]
MQMIGLTKRRYFVKYRLEPSTVVTASYRGTLMCSSLSLGTLWFSPLAPPLAPPVTPGCHSPWYSTGQWKNKNGCKRTYMIYNYCTDTKRFPQGSPPESAQWHRSKT